MEDFLLLELPMLLLNGGLPSLVLFIDCIYSFSLFGLSSV